MSKWTPFDSVENVSQSHLSFSVRNRIATLASETRNKISSVVKTTMNKREAPQSGTVKALNNRLRQNSEPSKPSKPVPAKEQETAKWGARSVTPTEIGSRANNSVMANIAQYNTKAEEVKAKQQSASVASTKPPLSASDKPTPQTSVSENKKKKFINSSSDSSDSSSGSSLTDSSDSSESLVARRRQVQEVKRSANVVKTTQSDTGATSATTETAQQNRKRPEPLVVQKSQSNAAADTKTRYTSVRTPSPKRSAIQTTVVQHAPPSTITSVGSPPLNRRGDGKRERLLSADRKSPARVIRSRSNSPVVNRRPGTGTGQTGQIPLNQNIPGVKSFTTDRSTTLKSTYDSTITTTDMSDVTGNVTDTGTLLSTGISTTTGTTNQQKNQTVTVRKPQQESVSEVPSEHTTTAAGKIPPNQKGKMARYGKANAPSPVGKKPFSAILDGFTSAQSGTETNTEATMMKRPLTRKDNRILNSDEKPYPAAGAPSKTLGEYGSTNLLFMGDTSGHSLLSDDSTSSSSSGSTGSTSSLSDDSSDSSGVNI